MEKKWVPKKGEGYYCINDEGRIVDYMYSKGLAERASKINNCFKTEEEAQFELEKIIFMNEIEQKFEPWKCDWKDENAKKYYLFYDCTYNKVSSYSNHYWKTQGTIYTNDKLIAEEYADNPDTLKYLFGMEPVEKKYILRLKTEIGMLYLNFYEYGNTEYKYIDNKDKAMELDFKDAIRISEIYDAFEMIEIEEK